MHDEVRVLRVRPTALVVVEPSREAFADGSGVQRHWDVAVDLGGRHAAGGVLKDELEDLSTLPVTAGHSGLAIDEQPGGVEHVDGGDDVAVVAWELEHFGGSDLRARAVAEGLHQTQEMAHVVASADRPAELLGVGGDLDDDGLHPPGQGEGSAEGLVESNTASIE
ncbi:hypothetical protein PQI23_04075 [Leucobacter sp. USCH14]|uniref:hypothetical protein n=1 Tax=Leucobacter sp. USCH14 TaxID=3024838 RepID=UPI0030AFB074